MNEDRERQARPAEGLGPSDEVRASIRQAIAADLRPKALRSAGARALLALAVLLGASALAVSIYGAPGLRRGLEDGRALAALLLTVCAAAALVFGGLAPRRGCIPTATPRIALAGAAALAWAIYLAANARVFGPGTALCAQAWMCLGRSALAAAVAALGIAWVWRRTDPFAPRAGALLVGAASGCVAAAATLLPCGSEAAGHLFVGHALVVLFAAALAALLGRRILSP